MVNVAYSSATVSSLFFLLATASIVEVTNGFGVIMPAILTPATILDTSSSPTLLRALSDDDQQQKHYQDIKTIMSARNEAKCGKSPSPLQSRMASALLATSLFLGASFVTNVVPESNNHINFFGVPPPALAFEGSKVVGALQGSGLVFKDTLQIERFEDPKIKGVVLYISTFDRPLTEKLSGGNFFNDPSYASVACAKTTKNIAIADNIQKGTQGEEVFEESRSLLFKTLRVQRIFDADSNTVVYVSYNTRFDKSDDTNKSRFKSSLCAVNLNDQ